MAGINNRDVIFVIGDVFDILSSFFWFTDTAVKKETANVRVSLQCFFLYIF